MITLPIITQEASGFHWEEVPPHSTPGFSCRHTNEHALYG